MKPIVITGATSGIGLETARVLAGQGYAVIGIGHNSEKCKRAREEILSGSPHAEILYLTADLMQQQEVLKAAVEITAYLDANSNGALYALINNAGCVRSWYMTTNEGYEQQFALNYLAGFLLTYQLLPHLRKAGGRIIMTGSGSHKGITVHWDDVMLRRGYNPLRAYKQSKLCDMLFAKGLRDRYPDGIHAYVVDPGLVNTDIGSKDTNWLVSLIWKLRKHHGVSPAVPAKTYAFLCNQQEPPEGFCYYLGKEIAYGRQVTGGNADRLFALSERLCGIRYGKEEIV